LQSQVRQLDATLPVRQCENNGRIVEEDLFPARMVAVLSASFAALAALLAALGIYAFWRIGGATQQEIGIRMALGRKPAMCNG